MKAAIATLLVCPACTKLEGANDTFAKASTMGGAVALGEGGSANSASDGGAGTFQVTGDPIAGRATDSAGGSNAGAGDAPYSGAAGAAGLAGGWGAAGAVSNACWDPTGLNGLGCNRCPPKTVTEFESACTSSICNPFDNRTRLAKLLANGKLPPLPQFLATGGNGSISGGAGTSGGSGGGQAGIANSGGTAGAGAIGAFTCDQLGTNGKLVYVTGSSAAKPFLQQIAQQLSTQNVFVIYTPTGSCVGVDAALNRTLLKTGPAPLPATSAIYWDSISSTGKPCQLPLTGVLSDIGISDVFAQTCSGFELSSLESQQVKAAHGPIQTMAFVVPSTSNYAEISAQAAYFVFGFGADGGVLEPAGKGGIWNDEAYLLTRSASSGTQAMLAAAIGVPSAQWRGKSHASSDEVSNALQLALGNSATANKALGILAVDYIDSKNLRPQIRILAFQDTNQPCAFYPDSTATARDKRNVRDGHYPIWSPLHLLYRVDASGSPENPSNRQEVSDILGYLSGSKALPNGIRLMDVFAASGLIPECAMRVSRTKDGGDLVPFNPGTPCACSFEQAATGTTTCKRCNVQGDCSAGEACSLGFCEG